MRKSIVIMVACCLGCIASYAQGEKQVRNGNKLYEQKKYKEAGAAYQQALQKNPTYVPGIFNLGNSLYQQKQYEASRKVLGNAAKVAKDKNSKAGANYNIGNTYMSEQKWQEAVDAYKQTLRNNPRDADAKYNLSYALQMLKKEQGGGGEDNKDNKDNKDKKDQNKDQQNKDNKDKNDKGDKDKKDQQDKGDQNKDQQDKGDQDKEQQRPQPQQSKLSQQQAEQLLNALRDEEKKLQDKMQKEKGIPVKTDKDW